MNVRTIGSELPRWGLWLSLAVLARSQAPAPVAAPFVVLEPFTVTGERELPPPESWLYASFDGFEVLSNASAYDTRRFLSDFRRFRDVLETLRLVPGEPGPSMTLILCDRDDKFLDFTPNGRRDAQGSVSLFLRDREQQVIVIDRETRLLAHADLAALLPGSTREELEVDHNRQLYREYIRSLFLAQEFPPPPWVIEGVTQIVTDVEHSDRSIFLGRLQAEMENPAVAPGGDRAVEDVTAMPPGWAPFTGNSLALIYGGIPPDEPVPVFDNRQFSRALLGRRLLPLAQLFSVTADSHEARNPLGNSLWSKQAYAFVHYCLFGRDDKFVKPYAQFVERLAKEPLSEPLFRECFGMGFAEMERQIEQYIRHPVHRYRKLKLAKDSRIVAQALLLRPASQGEIAQLKGDAQRIAGRHDDGLLTLRVAYARGERDPALLAALGVAEKQAGQTERARKFLEAAAKLGTERPTAWVTLARLRLDEAKASPAEAGRLSAAQLAAVFTPLLKARTLPPALPEVYAVMAEAWMASAVAPTPANIHVIGEGVMRFPFDSTLALQTAQLYARAGDVRDAAEVAHMGLRFAADAATRARFNEFLASLPPLPSGPPPADGKSDQSNS